eukprot:TRINITY_DN9362_c0_g1_i1.p1 TRINITY_DN9362_c0_g1~~TRINITY_DN9362_c0_g1_i1.p1  ORF type:complete len:114 (-),score=6.49 TRINITY_DN9362_c0_g1_i1:48-389(-)
MGCLRMEKIERGRRWAFAGWPIRNAQVCCQFRRVFSRNSDLREHSLLVKLPIDIRQLIGDLFFGIIPGQVVVEWVMIVFSLLQSETIRSLLRLEFSGRTQLLMIKRKSVAVLQ